MKTKVCSRCQERKDLTEFAKDRCRNDGFSPQCKTCKKEYDRKRYQKDPERFINYRKKYSKKHPEVNRKCCNLHREEMLKKFKQYYIEHREERIQKSREYYATHKEELKERRAKKALENAELLDEPLR